VTPEPEEAPVIVPLALGAFAAVAWSVRAYKATPFDELFREFGRRRAVDVDLLRAIARQESAYRPEVIDGRVKSSAGAIGLMQVMPANAIHYGFTPGDMTNPRKAVDVATRLLSEDRAGLIRRGRYALNLWIATYNAGLPRVLNLGERAAQAGYVAGVMLHYLQYKAAGVVFNRE
jgi:soluble lytic murein transglycosylase-like protein